MSVQIPPALAGAFSKGNVVAFVGAGMSRPQLPGWADLLRQMIEWARAEGIGLDGMEGPISELIERGKLLLAAHELRSRIGEGNFQSFIRQVFRDPKIVAGPGHRKLAAMGFAAILTTNYDTLIEQAFPARTPFHTQLDYPELAGLAHDRSFAIVKVHGDVDRLESIVLGQADYRKAIFSNESFRIFLSSLFTTRTVLFLGCSLTDPDLLALLEELKFKGALGGAHFGLMQTKGMNPLDRGDFEKSYGIRVLGDDLRDGPPDIPGFLEQLGAIPAKASEPERVKATVTEADAQDIAGLLEAMGHQILDQRPAGGFRHFLSSYKSGAQIRRVLTCYSSEAPRAADLEALHQATKTYEMDDGILLARQKISEDVARAASACGMQAYGREDFIGRLANFDRYLEKLRADYEAAGIEPFFVPLKIQRELAGEAKGAPMALDGFIDAWLSAQERNHLSLLGDFGTGKTWFSRRLAWQMAANQGGRIPIVIALRDYSRAYDIEQVLTDALSNRFGIALGAGFKTIRRLNDEGRQLLIFDGFDEMERRASDYRTALENFWEIAKLISPRAKILLTCRTAFFRHRTEEEAVLKSERNAVKVVKGDDVIDLSDRRKFEVAHLTEFDDEQIKEALRKLAPQGWEPLFDKIRALPNIEDLAHRPVLLAMIAKTLPSISANEELNLATLYQHYTGELLRKRVGSIPAEQRQYFVQELAWEMQATNKLSVPFSEFPDRVTSHFELKDDPAKAAFFERDIRTQSYLVRDDAGNYKFAHKSMMEFFVARKLAGMLAEGQVSDCPLTDAIASFVYHLLAQSYRYETHVDGDMVWVPPGPFIYGMESEGNLRVASLDQGFWMDRYPVTNDQFRAFLNERGNQAEGGAEWLEPKYSRIKTKGRSFVVEAGFERHPVTGVSWYGAAAFAATKGKRLPSEQEWEKASRGIDGRRYPWGEQFSAERCNTSESGIGTTTEAGKYGEAGCSVFGCEDVAGNVFEWTDSRWSEGSDQRVMRGGSWYGNHDDAACAARNGSNPVVRDYDVGFRCART